MTSESDADRLKLLAEVRAEQASTSPCFKLDPPPPPRNFAPSIRPTPGSWNDTHRPKKARVIKRRKNPETTLPAGVVEGYAPSKLDLAIARHLARDPEPEAIGKPAVVFEPCVGPAKPEDKRPKKSKRFSNADVILDDMALDWLKRKGFR